MSAREFFDKYLIPNVREWEGEPLYERRAMNAVLSLNHMADWFFLQSKDEAKLPMSVTGTKQYREHLVSAECPDFQIIWDVADAHKHFKLDRKSAKVKEVDQTKVGEMATAYQDYFAMETDPLKKAKNQLVFAQGLMDAQDFEKAASEFEKVLVDNPNDVTALSGAGLCLVNLGYISNDKAKFQTGANYLAKYIELAPDSDPVASRYKADAKGLLETLKKEQNVTAQKPVKTTPTKKKP